MKMYKILIMGVIAVVGTTLAYQGIKKDGLKIKYSKARDEDWSIVQINGLYYVKKTTIEV